MLKKHEPNISTKSTGAVRNPRAGITLISTLIVLILLAGFASAMMSLSVSNSRVIGALQSKQFEYHALQSAREHLRPYVAEFMLGDTQAVAEISISYQADRQAIEIQLEKISDRTVEITYQ